VTVLIPGTGCDVLAAPVEHVGQSAAQAATGHRNVNAVREAALGGEPA